MKCICFFEPRGNNGLEGYCLNQTYKYEFIAKDKNGKPYYRIYPDVDFKEYYEVCGPTVFKRYFKII